MDLDPLLLSRIQFAFTISFHILFPAFTIGLAAWIVVLEARWLATGRDIYRSLSEFWTRIFAVSFGMGVVSGVVMSYQFGTNWSRWSDVTGNIIGPLASYEVVAAFFLEAGFLGILLFGRRRVPRPMHFLAACAVSAGTLLSAFWILSANSWMQTPAGYEIRDGRFFPVDWWAIVFNPSFPYRLAHMVTATFITTALVVAGVSAWYLLQRRHLDHARIGFSMALGLLAVLAPLQLVIGDLHGLNTLEHQPVKVSAMEGHWETQRGAPLIVFAWPDEKAETNRFQIDIPKLSSLILHHDLDAETKGLKEWPRDQRPDVPIVFWSFRVMVGIGLILLAIAVAGLWLRWRGRLYESALFQRICVAASPLGFLALLAGWVTTEAGRQPWIVYGLVRTADGVTPSLTGHAALASLLTFAVVYALIFTAGTYYLVRTLQTGPAPVPSDEARPVRRGAGRSTRPLSLPDEAIEPAAGWRP